VRPSVFSPADLEDIQRRAAAGESTPSIAKSYGTSHQNVQNALKRVRRVGGAELAGGAVDDFEKAQLATFRRLRKQIKSLEGRDLAVCTKALNDTIKEIRKHRALSKQTAPDDEIGAAAERVRSKLAAMRQSSKPVAAGPTPVEVESNGTDGR
jgi:hypothetical protein